MKFRLYSNIFRKNTAVFSHNGNQIHVGDEIGNLNTIDLNAIFPSTSVQKEPQSINEIKKNSFEGELDKDEIEEQEGSGKEPVEGKFRNSGIDVTYREDPLGFESINYLMKQVFLDLRRGTGATVISSSGGTELAFESPKYKNGLFTYSLIDGLKNKKADINKDEIITVSELQAYLIEEVKQLSNGKQVPTSRIHNKEMDYRVW